MPGNDKRQFQLHPYFGNEKRQLHIRSSYQTKQTVDWQLFQGLYRSRDTIRDKNPIWTLRPHLFELRDARRASFNTFSIVPQLFPVSLQSANRDYTALFRSAPQVCFRFCSQNKHKREFDLQEFVCQRLMDLDPRQGAAQSLSAPSTETYGLVNPWAVFFLCQI